MVLEKGLNVQITVTAKFLPTAALCVRRMTAATTSELLRRSREGGGGHRGWERDGVSPSLWRRNTLIQWQMRTDAPLQRISQSE